MKKDSISGFYIFEAGAQLIHTKINAESIRR
jgi:hypothetical protein